MHTTFYQKINKEWKSFKISSICADNVYFLISINIFEEYTIL